MQEMLQMLLVNNSNLLLSKGLAHFAIVMPKLNLYQIIGGKSHYFLPGNFLTQSSVLGKIKFKKCC